MIVCVLMYLRKKHLTNKINNNLLIMLFE